MCLFLRPRKFRSCYERKNGTGAPSRDGDDDDNDDEEEENNNNGEARRESVSLPPPPLAAESPSSSAPPSSPSISTPTVSCNIVETSLESLQTEPNTRDGEKRRIVPLEYCRHRIANAGS